MVRRTKFLFAAIALTVMVALPGAVAAQTITFGGLSGSNGQAFTGPYVEAGYTISLIAGTICEAHAFGNPTPDLFGGNICQGDASATLSVTRGGGMFRFLGADLATANGDTSWQFRGLIGGGGGYLAAGTISPPQVFQAVGNPGSGIEIDELRITLTNGTGTSFNIDNIGLVASVPEPGSMMLLAGGLFGLVGIRRRKEDDVS